MITAGPVTFANFPCIVVPPWQTLSIMSAIQGSTLQPISMSGGTAMVYDGTDSRFTFDDSLVSDDGGFVTPPEMTGFQKIHRHIRRGFREFQQKIRDGIAEGGIAASGDSHTLAQMLPPKGPIAGGVYLTDRRLAHASVFTQISMGISLHTWLIHEMIAACNAGQEKFRIAVLGHGDGNTEAELVEHLAAAKVRHNLHTDIDIFSITLDSHPMTRQNHAVIGRYSDSGIFFHEIFADFDKQLPLDNIDVLYGIASTIYSRDPLNLTICVHDVLRKPSAGRPGGQAFFKYWSASADPAFEMARHFFDLRRFGFDIAISAPSSDEFDNHAFTHMTRISARPAKRLGDAIAAVESMPRLEEFRTIANSESVVGENKAFDVFVFGANLLFAANGLPPGALPGDMHRQTFDCVYPAVAGGTPIYPDSVLIAYGLNLDAIAKHGKNFRQHTPSGFMFNPIFYMPKEWTRRYRPLM